MGQKIHPTGFRLSVTRDWSSRWYADSKNFSTMLNEDVLVRDYLKEKLKHASVGRVLIERPAKNARVTVFSARPGVVIGKKGEEMAQLRQRVQALERERSQRKQMHDATVNALKKQVAGLQESQAEIQQFLSQPEVAPLHKQFLQEQQRQAEQAELARHMREEKEYQARKFLQEQMAQQQKQQGEQEKQQKTQQPGQPQPQQDSPTPVPYRGMRMGR